MTIHSVRKTTPVLRLNSRKMNPSKLFVNPETKIGFGFGTDADPKYVAERTGLEPASDHSR